MQVADIGHPLAPEVTGTPARTPPTSSATAMIVRKIGSTLTLDVRRVHPAPGRRRLVWMAISFMTTERPWATDGGTVTAYKKKDGQLKELGRAVVTRGAAFVRLPWKQRPVRPQLRDGLLPRLRRGRGELLAVRRGAPRQLAQPNQPGAAATNASRSSAPAPSGITASSGAIRGRSSRLHRSASPGSAGQAPMTRPRTVSPRARSASTVSSVWLRVPSPAATTTTTSTSATASSSDGEVEQRAALGVQPDQQPAGALDDHGVLREPRDPLGVRRHDRDVDPLAPGGGVGGERLVERRPLLGLDAGEPGDLAGVGVTVERAGLHGLHDEHATRWRSRPARRSRRSCRRRSRCR